MFHKHCSLSKLINGSKRFKRFKKYPYTLIFFVISSSTYLLQMMFFLPW